MDWKGRVAGLEYSTQREGSKARGCYILSGGEKGIGREEREEWGEDRILLGRRCREECIVYNGVKEGQGREVCGCVCD